MAKTNSPTPAIPAIPATNEVLAELQDLRNRVAAMENGPTDVKIDGASRRFTKAEVDAYLAQPASPTVFFAQNPLQQLVISREIRYHDPVLREERAVPSVTLKFTEYHSIGSELMRDGKLKYDRGLGRVDLAEYEDLKPLITTDTNDARPWTAPIETWIERVHERTAAEANPRMRILTEAEFKAEIAVEYAALWTYMEGRAELERKTAAIRAGAVPGDIKAGAAASPSVAAALSAIEDIE
jgi:hypothetical protein